MGSQKQPSHQEQLRWAIDAALEEKPKDFEELLKKLEATGIEVNRERKYLRFRLSPENRYTRCDTLKGDYTEQGIRERIGGTRTVKPRRASPQKPVSKVGLLVDIEAAIRSGIGPGYERWAKVFNLKQLSQAVLYLKEHGDMSYEDLQKKSDAATASVNALSVQVKELESQMTANGELQKQIVNYAKTRAVYVEYRKAGYGKKFRAAHETKILLHQAAKKHFDELGITKLPSVKSLREEYAGLLEQKRKAYAAYKQARADMKELYNIRANWSICWTFPPDGNRRETRRSHGNRFPLLLVFSVPTERAAITAGDDLRGLGTCHQQAFWQEYRKRILAKIRKLTEECIACRYCPEFGITSGYHFQV